MLSLIIPAFNESGNLEITIPHLIGFMDQREGGYEIIISEDGSTDSTHEVARMLSEKYGVRFTHSDKRLGKGGSLKRASEMARGGKIIFMDADMPVNMGLLDVMGRELETSDVVIGSRYMKGSKVSRTSGRSFMSRVYHLIAGMAFPELKLSDIKCGVKGFRKDVFLSINKETRENGWSWDLEFLIRARKRGVRIKEIPVEWQDRRGARFEILTHSLSQVMDIFSIRLRVLF